MGNLQITNDTGSITMAPEQVLAVFQRNSQLVVISIDDTVDTLNYTDEAELATAFTAAVERIAAACKTNFTWLQDTAPTARSFLNLDRLALRDITQAPAATEKFPVAASIALLAMSATWDSLKQTLMDA